MQEAAHVQEAAHYISRAARLAGPVAVAVTSYQSAPANRLENSGMGDTVNRLQITGHCSSYLMEKLQPLCYGVCSVSTP